MYKIDQLGQTVLEKEEEQYGKSREVNFLVD